MRLVWLWRHPQSLEYLLTTEDARFHTLGYFARQNEVLAIAPGGPGWQFERTTLPGTSRFTVALGPDVNAVFSAVVQWKPDVVVAEGTILDPEWSALRPHLPEAYFVFYYGGGPLLDVTQDVPEMLRLWDLVIVPHDAQRRLYEARGLNVIRGWGVPTHVFTPLGLPKVWHALYPANFAPGKRNALFTEYLERYAAGRLPSLACGALEHPAVVEMARMGGIPLNRPGPHRNGCQIAGRIAQPVMPVIYNLSTVLVSTSQEEGHPNCVFEAMACGTPAIVMADCEWEVAEACHELADGSARLGLQVVDPWPQAIHEAVERVLKHYDVACAEARELIIQKMDWWTMYERIDQALRNGLALKQAGQQVA